MAGAWESHPGPARARGGAHAGRAACGHSQQTFSAAIAAGALPAATEAAPGAELSLKPTSTGYALVSPSGRVAYSADGARARERCLRRALQMGAIRLR